MAWKFFFGGTFHHIFQSRHTLYLFLYRYQWEKEVKTPMKGFWPKPLQRVFDWILTTKWLPTNAIAWLKTMKKRPRRGSHKAHIEKQFSILCYSFMAYLHVTKIKFVALSLEHFLTLFFLHTQFFFTWILVMCQKSSQAKAFTSSKIHISIPPGIFILCYSLIVYFYTTCAVVSQRWAKLTCNYVKIFVYKPTANLHSWLTIGTQGFPWAMRKSILSCKWLQKQGYFLASRLRLELCKSEGAQTYANSLNRC